MKEFTTNLEDLRLETEELVAPGPNVNPVQLWRDASHIPENIPAELAVEYEKVNLDENQYSKATVFTVVINGSIQKIIDHYLDVPLTRIPGTENCYRQEDILKDIIDPHYGKGYLYKIYIDNEIAPFGIGQPLFDVEMGILKFQDPIYAKAIKDKKVTISFYKYVGRKGMTNVESLPFSDDLLHFKNSDDPSKTITFKVRADGHQDYILPIGKKAYDKGDIENTSVLVSQESISNVLYNYGVIDGGTW